MRKIHIILIITIIITIATSLFSNRDFGGLSNKIDKSPMNPSGAEVQILNEPKVLGDSTEKIKPSNKTKKEIFEVQKLYSLINSYRKENKLSSLNPNQSLETSAKRKVADMIENNYFKHRDNNNIESWYLFKTSGYEFKTAGENLSSGANSPWKVFDAWINSEAHNFQILNDNYFDMGISADCESYKIARKSSCIVVLHLGSR